MLKLTQNINISLSSCFLDDRCYDTEAMPTEYRFEIPALSRYNRCVSKGGVYTMPKTHAAEKKATALRLCIEHGIKEASKQTGIGLSTVYMWCNDAMRNASSADAHSEFYLSKRRSATQRLEALRLYEEIRVIKRSMKTGVSFRTI